MKCRIWMWMTAVCLFAARVVTLQLSAQNNPELKTKHHHKYRVVDVGTFGGPTSDYNSGSVIINGRGAVVGVADTSIFDPNCSCFVTHAFRWEDGVVTD